MTLNYWMTVERGWGEPTRIMVPWKQGFRHPTRNECMGWFTQISGKVSKPNGVVGGSIPRREIVSLLDRKLAMWSNASCVPKKKKTSEPPDTQKESKPSYTIRCLRWTTRHCSFPVLGDHKECLSNSSWTTKESLKPIL